MSKTLRFGSRPIDQHIANRIDRHVIRRHTVCGFQRLQELAAEDYARHVAFEVSPGQRQAPSLPKVTYRMDAPGFGKRHNGGSR